MKITRAKYPNIFKAFDDIIADNVASSTITAVMKKKLEEGYKVKDKKINVGNVESFLTGLPDEDREILTMGDQDEAKGMYGKKKGYRDADRLLGEFFNTM